MSADHDGLLEDQPIVCGFDEREWEGGPQEAGMIQLSHLGLSGTLDVDKYGHQSNAQEDR